MFLHLLYILKINSTDLNSWFFKINFHEFWLFCWGTGLSSILHHHSVRRFLSVTLIYELLVSKVVFCSFTQLKFSYFSRKFFSQTHHLVCSTVPPKHQSDTLESILSCFPYIISLFYKKSLAFSDGLCTSYPEQTVIILYPSFCFYHIKNV